MGDYKHHAIVITASLYDENAVQELHRFCKESPLSVTDIVRSRFGDYSFMVCPDGSKEGWYESNEGDKWRKIICDKIDQMAYDDGSNQFQFAEIMYGNDLTPPKAELVRTNSGQPGHRVLGGPQCQ